MCGERSEPHTFFVLSRKRVAAGAARRYVAASAASRHTRTTERSENAHHHQHHHHNLRQQAHHRLRRQRSDSGAQPRYGMSFLKYGVSPARRAREKKIKKVLIGCGGQRPPRGMKREQPLKRGKTRPRQNILLLSPMRSTRRKHATDLDKNHHHQHHQHRPRQHAYHHHHHQHRPRSTRRPKA